MLAKILPCQPSEPGFAQLMIRLRGEDALLANLNFTLCNNEQNYLQPDGHWSPEPHWFTINGGYAFNNGSGFRIGPDILDPLLTSPSQVQIQAKLATGKTLITTLQLARDELFSSGARGQTAHYGGSSVLDTPDTAPETVPETEAEPTPDEPIRTPTAARPKRNTSLVPIIIAVLLVLLIAAGALWWFMGRDNATPTAAAKQPEAPVVAEAAKADANACSPANLTSQTELDFVQNCVQQKLDSDKLLAIIQAAKQAKQCGVAQRLYAHSAQGGDTRIALAYAAEYDPQGHQPSECFKTPDPDTAAYWYETVLQTDPENQKAKQRLAELRK
ncbi:hypothetical protein [Pantoea phytobeneficialis]|uniref:Uncharacterized protein n=1 Tax=Pantoea phytobeneficialis TaxID=2052056 RepID=A0AAP9HA67_9GAMM|nr:hypothetical protein [Pantoea phytobeneficialis]MDO6406488.1 hypothetical protein [Pantoea phytobeneficialis]QGR09585.1 hypothetical protein CTZ24_24270 [Pantoea phytobeneficialis]